MKHAPISRPCGKGILELMETFQYMSRYGLVTVRKGKKWNGSSMPGLAKLPLGLECFSPSLHGPSLVHDDGYGKQIFTRKQYDQIYYDMMVENGIAKWKARWSYKGLYFGGEKAWRASK